jgi:uncharacterized protein
MDWKKEWKKLAAIVAVFLLCFYLPIGWKRFDNAVMESLYLIKWYAQEHVLLCLVPAFFIAGAISVFVSQASVMKYLGPKANKVLAYGVASVSGSVLAVCSCTILPLFAGIWRMGAGLGPATAFLYSGPAINVLAIILTARILGLEIGIARAVGAISFSIIIGLIMHYIYRKEEIAKAEEQMTMPEPEVRRPLWQNALFFAIMIGVLVFANWGSSNDFIFKTVDGSTIQAVVLKSPEHSSSLTGSYTIKVLYGIQKGQELYLPVESVLEKTPVPGTWTSIWSYKWVITAVLSASLGIILILWFNVSWWKVAITVIPVLFLSMILPMKGMMVMIPFTVGVIGLSWMTSTNKGEAGEWFASTWTFAKQILPLLFFGVLFAGLFLGRPGYEGLIPNRWVEWAVGGNSLRANLLASVAGAFMYFATLTEVPILQGLIGSGMGKGPALSLLLAGPALSLPSMLVLRSIMGTQKTVVYVTLVIVMSTITGIIFGAFYG